MKKSKLIIPSIAISSLTVVTLPLVLTSCGKKIDVMCTGSDYNWASTEEVSINRKNQYILKGIAIPSDATKIEIRVTKQGSPFVLGPYYVEFNGNKLEGDGSVFDVSQFQGQTGPFVIKFQMELKSIISIKFTTN